MTEFLFSWHAQRDSCGVACSWAEALSRKGKSNCAKVEGATPAITATFLKKNGLCGLIFFFSFEGNVRSLGSATNEVFLCFSPSFESYPHHNDNFITPRPVDCSAQGPGHVCLLCFTYPYNHADGRGPSLPFVYEGFDPAFTRFPG